MIGAPFKTQPKPSLEGPVALEWYDNERTGLNLLEGKSIGTLIVIDPEGSIA